MDSHVRGNDNGTEADSVHLLRKVYITRKYYSQRAFAGRDKNRWALPALQDC